MQANANTTKGTNELMDRAAATAGFVSRAMRSSQSRRRSGDCWVDADDGTRLYVRDIGAGYPLVFLHSWMLSSQMWQYQVAALTTQGYRCITFDRRGHGRSDEPGRGYDIDRLTGDLECVLDVLDLDASAPLALTGAPTAALVRHAAFKVYEGAPHGLFVTHKERVNADLLEFLAEDAG